MPDAPPRLTTFSHGAGCGCKLGPAALADVLGRLAPVAHPDLLVGAGTGDDAAVWRLDAERALVVTTDFFTPVVDDARTWGRIAATNAASDVYAMGGRPLLALNLVAWPVDVLGPDLLAEVLAGGAAAAAAGGWLPVGGHSIDDPEPKYGQAVVGEVHPDRILTNAGLAPGDALVLTKPLGTGAVLTAAKRDAVGAADLQAAVDAMCDLNDVASRAAVAVGVRAATDVTGFGLLGHLKRMAAASSADVVVEVGAVPALPGARAALAAGMVSGGTRRNADWVADVVDAPAAVEEVDRWLLADAQTSGGLLLGVPADRVDDLLAELAAGGVAGAVVGAVRDRGTGRIALSAPSGPG